MCKASRISIFSVCCLIYEINWLAADNQHVCNSTEIHKISEREVLNVVFKNYTKDVRPRQNVSEPVEVTLSLRLNSINDLIERENTLIMDGFLYVFWKDDYLSWHTWYPYSCVKQLVVPYGRTWLPDISVINSPTGMYALMLEPGFTTWIDNDGTVQFTPGGQIVTKCEVEVTYFPFDIQVCQIHVESWNYDTRQQTFVLDTKSSFTKVLTTWTENKQWEVVSNRSTVCNVTYFDDKATYAHATFTLTLRRKSLFYYINIIVPSIIISVVELSTFVLPIEEVMKLHISFTCLLAYSVFQGMVINDLPRSGDSVPLLSLYIDLQMAYIGIIALMGEAVVFLAIRSAEISKTLPSRFLFKIAINVGQCLLVCAESSETPPRRLSYHPRTIERVGSISTAKKADAVEAVAVAAERDVYLTASSMPNNIRQQWLYIAEVIERFNMVVYTCFIVVTPIAMFIIAPAIRTDSMEQEC